MLIGQSLIAPDTSDEGQPYVYYGPWFPRGSDAATFVAQVLLSGGTFSLEIEVEHKNSEDSDPGSPAGSFPAITDSPKTEVVSITGLKELVRYKYILSGPEGPTWVHARSNPPIWQPN